MDDHGPDVPDPTDSLTAPAALRTRDGIDYGEETRTHEDRERCNVDSDGRAVVGVTNDDGELLTVLHDDASIALLPHETVDPGADWAVAARAGVEGQTGVAVALDSVEAVRVVSHVVDGEAEPHATTHRVVFGGSPVGGSIQACKRDAATGSDGWRAAWVERIPEGSPAADFRHFADLASITTS